MRYSLDVKLTSDQLDVIIDVLVVYEGPELCAHDEWGDLLETLSRQRDVAEAAMHLPAMHLPAKPTGPPTIDPEIARMMEALG